MASKKYIPAKIKKIISFESKSGYRRNYKKEDRIYNKVYIESREPFSHSYGGRIEKEYEDELFYQKGFTDSVERDENTGELILKSYQCWEEYTLLVEYTYENRTYSTEVVVDGTKNEYTEGQNIFVSIIDTNPEHVYGISNKDLNGGFSIYHILGMFGLFFLLTILFLVYLSLR